MKFTQSIQLERLSATLWTEDAARLMSASDPWLTLGRTLETCLAILTDPTLEQYAILLEGKFVGLLVLQMQGAFVGYIKSIALTPETRGNGIGTEVLRLAEERIFSETPNVFLCVSSFNTRARQLYERLGYEYIGELQNYIIAGASEFLFRKTCGTLKDFLPKRTTL